MNVKPATVPFGEFSSDAGRASKGKSGYGDDFENAVRSVSKETASEPGVQDKAARGPDDADHAPRDEKGATSTRRRKESEADTKANGTSKADDAAEDAAEETSRAVPLDLAQVISSLAPAATPGAGTPAQTAADETVPDGAAMLPVLAEGEDGTPETALEGKGARGAVRLEVIGMETHFEPTLRDGVLVEGSADAASPPSAGSQGSGAPAIKLTFDEMLQRLDRGTVLEGEPTTLATDSAASQDTRTAAASLRAGLRGKDGTAETSREKESSVALAGALQDGGDELAASDAALPRASVSKREPGSTGEGRGQRFFAADAAVEPEGEEAGLARTSTTALPGSTSAAAIASLTSQVAGRVIDSFGGAGFAQRQADLPSGETHLRMQAGGAALKTLTIQLQPENLGRLEVSMRLVDGKLTLEVAATEHHTAQVLAGDREGLRKLLEHAGFSLDDGSIVIQTRDASVARQASDALGQQDGSAGGQGRDGSSSGQSQGRSSGDGAPANGNEPRRQDGPRSGQAGEPAVKPQSGTVYL